MEENFVTDFDAAFDVCSNESDDCVYDLIMAGMVEDDAFFTTESANAMGLKKLATSFNTYKRGYFG